MGRPVLMRPTDCPGRPTIDFAPFTLALAMRPR